MDPNVATNQPPSIVASVSPVSSPVQSVSPTPAPIEEKKTFPWVLVTVIICLVFLVGAGSILFIKYHSSVPPSSEAVIPTSSNGVPQVKVTDLSPSVPNSQKTVVLVEHSDSSMEKFIMATDLVAGYLKALPVGDRVVSQSSAAQ